MKAEYGRYKESSGLWEICRWYIPVDGFCVIEIPMYSVSKNTYLWTYYGAPLVQHIKEVSWDDLTEYEQQSIIEANLNE